MGIARKIAAGYQWYDRHFLVGQFLRRQRRSSSYTSARSCSEARGSSWSRDARKIPRNGWAVAGVPRRTNDVTYAAVHNNGGLTMMRPYVPATYVPAIGLLMSLGVGAAVGGESLPAGAVASLKAKV